MRVFSSSYGYDTVKCLEMYNSLTGRVERLPETVPGSLSVDERPKALACYACGPTVYAPAHLGHARTYVWLDIFRRVWEDSCEESNKPLFVLNITDVDDKILAAADSSGEAPLALARRYEESFWRDWDALNCLRPHVVTRVTEHVDTKIVPYIERLVELGMAYEVKRDGVYFDVNAYEEACKSFKSHYGKLAPQIQSSESFLSGTALFDGKKDQRDFALWKGRKEGERMYWSSPWGDGRPGWHIECSAMIESIQSLFYTEYTFAVHAGGVDLQFPHHCNEIAQAEAYHLHHMSPGQEWIRHWIHTGPLHIDGLKMSKSLKNYITINEMLTNEGEGGGDLGLVSPADDFRLWCLGLSGSYRAATTYSKERMDHAKVVRQKIVRFLVDAEAWLQRSKSPQTRKWTDDDYRLFISMRESAAKGMNAIRRDLDGSTFLDCIIEISDQGSKYLAKTKPENAPTEHIVEIVRSTRDMLALVGFSDSTCQAGVESENINPSYVVGGAGAVIDELQKFRESIRGLALGGINDAEPVTRDRLIQALQLCDELRDKIMPSMGVELLDGRVTDHGEGLNTDARTAMWRYCIPRSFGEGVPNNSQGGPNRPPLTELEKIAPGEFFRVGQYENEFSEFDEDGFPTRLRDGSEISNNLRKKLKKKLDKHLLRLQKHGKYAIEKLCKALHAVISNSSPKSDKRTESTSP